MKIIRSFLIYCVLTKTIKIYFLSGNKSLFSSYDIYLKFCAKLRLQLLFKISFQDQQNDSGVFLARFQQMQKMRIPVCIKSVRKLLDLCAQIKNNQFAICDEG